ncbi:MAG TPA: AtpZ/AtpI family protein [Aestuariivirga sp.]
MMKKPGKTPVDDRIQNFEKRLDESVAAQSGSPKVDTTESSAAGLALRIVSELFVGVAVCMFGGYYLDRYLGTTPWIMIGLMPVGLAAGVLNVMRLSNTKQAKEVMGEGMPIAPSVKDDDED